MLHAHVYKTYPESTQQRISNKIEKQKLNIRKESGSHSTQTRTHTDTPLQIPQRYRFEFRRKPQPWSSPKQHRLHLPLLPAAATSAPRATSVPCSDPKISSIRTPEVQSARRRRWWKPAVANPKPKRPKRCAPARNSTPWIEEDRMPAELRALLLLYIVWVRAGGSPRRSLSAKYRERERDGAKRKWCVLYEDPLVVAN